MGFFTPKRLLIVFISLLIIIFVEVFILIKNQNKDKSIKLVSQVKGYQIKWKDKKGFENYLNNIGFWDENGITITSTNGFVIGRGTASNLIIKITPDVTDPYIYIYGSKKGGVLWSSAGINQKNGTVEIEVFRRDWKIATVNSLINASVLVISKYKKRTSNTNELIMAPNNFINFPSIFFEVIKT